ncbi:MAG TPA: amino acid permease [Ferruginibacter sp.]|nr:amino acid permease [Chitinophagaceae bacterium]HQW92616.1 amino acid permease [Ferruginibacter sp.]
MPEQATTFKPTLGLLDSTMIVAGSMIGSGIFIVSADIARNVGSAGWLIAVWVITGFMTLTAALSYAELSAMFPKAGGQYVYLKEAFNPLAGFLYGWSFFTVIQTATIAAVGVAFSKFSAYIFPALSEKNILFDLGFLQISAAQIVAILLIALLTFINSKGIKNGTIIQTVFTTTKLLSLFGLIIFGFILAASSDIWNANWADAFSMKAWNAGTSSWTGVAGTAIIGAIAAAMVGSIFSSDAWNNITFIAGEVKNPKRNIGLALFFGTGIVTLIYVATNLMYVSVLPMNEIAFAENDRVAVTASHVIFGNAGTYVIAIMIMISTFGCNNGLILAGARVYNAMAIDKLFFKKAATLNRYAVPEYALWAQFVMASVLCLSGKYGDLLDMISFVVVLFYAITIIGIFKLRKTRPDVERPYKAFGYPVLPAIYILMALVFCIFLIIIKPLYAGIGLGIVLLGIPVYYLSIGGQKKE